MTEANPHELGITLKRHATTLEQLATSLDMRGDDLSSLLVTTYDVEHAEEHITWIVTELEKTAATLRSLLRYTRTGAAREAAWFRQHGRIREDAVTYIAQKEGRSTGEVRDHLSN